MKLLPLCLSLLLLCSCALKSPVPEKGEASDLWERMLTASNEDKGPFRLQMSIRFGEEGNTRRVTAIIWGNGDDVLRLDVMAGVGATIAKIRQSANEFLLYSPRENRAFAHAGTARPLLKIGMPVPFDLEQLADLLTGRFSQVFGLQYLSCENMDKGAVKFALESPPGGELTLNAQGAPIFWRQSINGWTLEFAYDDGAPLLPTSLRLRNADGKMAFMLVKDRDGAAVRFSPEQMSLDLPAGVKRLPLAQYKPE